ncbi:MAG: GH92 family glycosyl hydrolase [Bacteroidales bacterium]|nr:GH92 family glycosyl hydrolase [Bacteroidales bacterium]
MKKSLLSISLGCICLAVTLITQLNAQSQYVNPLVGTAEHGHTFPGAIVPFGAVQVSPDTRLDGWDGCSGYHYTDNRIYGFSHTHLSGTGCSDYGDILIMPFFKTASVKNEEYSCTFSHSNEKAAAGYYQVTLDNGIKVELTADQHGAMHRYTFPKKGERGIVIDLTHRDKTLASGITHRDNEFYGFRRSDAWNPNQYCAFSIIPSEPVQRIEYYINDKMVSEHDVRGENCKAILYFDKKVKSVTLHVGISAVDIEGAMKNRESIMSYSFDQLKDKAIQAWDKELSKIEVSSSNTEYLKVFYTALYHCFTSPYLYTDVDGRYRGMDQEIHQVDAGKTIYTVFSLWDTYRALHPLLNIIDQKRSSDFLYTFMQQYKQGGMLPIWELSSFETWCMIGYHSIPVIWDAYQKGLIPANEQKAFLDAMVSSARMDTHGRKAFAENGFISGIDDNESVSKNLEYAYDDWCIAQYAKALGQNDIYKEFIKRAQAYKNILDENHFMHGRLNGGRYTPFNPTEVNNYFTEANSWQYSTYVPQDIPEYVNMLGGPAEALRFWKALFTASSDISGRQQSDITGMIGQYAHGNEPSHHAAYLFNYLGTYKYTQKYTKQIMTELYTSKPDGLCGNEDCGQMSAWYVFSAMGFYPVCPGSNEYALGFPLMDKATIHLENGNTFTVIKDSDKPYVKEVLYNGKRLASPFIRYHQIHTGGTLEFLMTDNESECLKFNDLTILHQRQTIPAEDQLTPAPIMSTNKSTFSEAFSVTINNYAPKNQPDYAADTKIYYTTDGTIPTKENGHLYQQPLTFTDATTLKAVAYNDKTGYSYVVTANYKLYQKDRDIQYITHPNPQYFAGGNDGLIDNERGPINYRIGGWQGFTGDCELIIDLHHSTPITKVGAGCLEEQRAWIFYPYAMEVSVSDDGEHFTSFGTQAITTTRNDNAHIQDVEVKGSATARYVKVKLRNYGKLPSWHISAGEQAWLFIDEIWVK